MIKEMIYLLRYPVRLLNNYNIFKVPIFNLKRFLLDYHSVTNTITQLQSFLAITPAISTVFIFILVLLFVASFLLSGAQVAYFSLTIKDINILKTRTQPSYRRIVNLLETPKNLYTVIIIANTIVNIAIIFMSNMLLDEWVKLLLLPDSIIILIKIIIITLAIVIFGEILPKVWASHHKIWFASTSSMVVELTSLLLNKISRQVVRFNNGIESIFSSGKKNEEKDVQANIDMLDEEDASKEEKQILKGILRFGNTTVKQVMKTRLDIVGIDITFNFDQLLSKVATLTYSRLPVYNGNLDEMVGILHTKDLLPHLKEVSHFDWQSLLRPVYYIHEQKLIEDLLQDFRNKRIHMAVVVDEFGGTAGIITLEDVIEEIVGEIQDEFDEEDSRNYKVDNNTFIFEGKIMINDACKIMQIPETTFDDLRGDSDSLGGLVLEIAGDFPKENSELHGAGFIFKPLQIVKNRIIKIQVTAPGNINDEN